MRRYRISGLNYVIGFGYFIAPPPDAIWPALSLPWWAAPFLRAMSCYPNLTFDIILYSSPYWPIPGDWMIPVNPVEG
jgi:hypothetical protein